VTESFDWKTGLDMQVHEAKEFYGIIAFATVGGVMLNFTRLDPIRALLWSADINCVIAVPIMAVMMMLGADATVMGTFVVRSRLRKLGWLATAVMGATVCAMFATM
jgi:Mn2+/Fe2+ NRAMP family transporter